MPDRIASLPRRRVLWPGVAKVAVVVLAAGAVVVVSAPARAPSSSDRARRLGRVDPRAIVPLTIALRMPGAADLDAYVNDRPTGGRSSPLSPAQIGERFGLPRARIDDLIAQLTRAGIHVTERYEQRTALLGHARATVAERVFNVRLFRYSDHGATFWRPSTTPRTPTAWATDVQAVFGLDTSLSFRPRARPRAAATQPSAQPLTPQQLAHVYQADTLHSSGIDGTGQNVAVLSLATLRGKEVPLWATHFGTRVGSLETVSVPPTPAGPTDPDWDSGGEAEVALDLEMVRAVAPGATILNYTTANDRGALVRMVNRVVADGRAKVITTSWGGCEPDQQGEMQADEVAFAAAQAAGVDTFAASGDSGPYDCSTDTHLDPTVTVDYPGSSPHAIGVGGTTLETTTDGRYLRETGWWTPDAAAGGGGGGVSEVFARPSWQTGARLAGNATAASGQRLVPDVAGPGDDTTNLEIAIWEPARQGYVLAVAGGTSAAAPFWAATLGLIRQYAVVSARKPIAGGNFGAVLYRISATSGYRTSFHDVTAGSNPSFAAAAGWDAITGLGSPQIPELASQVTGLTG